MPAPGVLFAGTQLGAPVPILGFQLWVSPLLALNVASDASGSATIPVAIRADPMLVGVPVDLQLIWLGPTAPPPCPPIGLSASNALEITIQP